METITKKGENEREKIGSSKKDQCPEHKEGEKKKERLGKGEEKGR